MKVVERDPACCGNCPLQAPQRRRSHSLVGGELRETNPYFFVWFDSLSYFSSIFDVLLLRSTWVCYLCVQGSLPCLRSSTKAIHQIWFMLEVKRCLKLFLQVLCATPVWPVSPVKSSAWPIWPVITTGLTCGALSAQVFGEKEFNLVVTPIQPPPSRRYQGPFRYELLDSWQRTSNATRWANDIELGVGDYMTKFQFNILHIQTEIGFTFFQ
jgi:hypothetical protein